jgi:hypothetical protein
MYKDQMHCQVVVGVYERTIADVDEFASLEPLCVISPESNQDLVLNLINPPTIEPVVSPGTNPTTEPDGGPEYPSEPELEPDRQPDMFDNEEEYVGVDDEGMYTPVPPHQQTNNAHAQATNSTHLEPFANADANDGGAAAEGGVPLEAEVDDANPQEVQVIHDSENPKIVKGGLFPDIVSFKKGIRHYAVKKGFEFAGLHTDKTRFIVNCKTEGCP